MSADLFAEFGDFSQPSQTNNNNNNNQNKPPLPYAPPNNVASDPFAFLGATSPPAATPFPPSIPPSFQNQTTSIPWQAGGTSSQSNTGFGGGGSWASLTTGNGNGSIAKNVAEEDDGWGDFEVASPVDTAFPQTATQPSFSPPSQTAPSGAASAEPRTRIVRASTLDLISNNLIDVPGPGKSKSKLDTFEERPSYESDSFKPLPPHKDPPKSRNSNPNVLFDAEDYDPNEAVPGDDEDDFGDFETVAAPSKPAAAPPSDLMGLDWTTPSTNQVSTQPTPSNAKREPPSDLFSTLTIGDSTSFPQAPKSPGFQERNPFPGLAVVTPNVGDFPKESGEVTSPPTAWPAADQFTVASANKTSFADDWAAFEDIPSSKPEPPKAAQQSFGWDWDAVDSTGQETAPSKQAQPQPKAAAPYPASSFKAASKVPIKQAVPDPEPDSSWDWDATDDPTPAQAPTSAPPASTAFQAPPDTTPAPTNIPPPSILLSLFTSLLDLANTSLFKPTASASSSIRARVLADPQTATFLSGFLALATVAGRLIAGRKLRWQRDRFLSQRMAISEVGGKGGRGMKLASIDRSQATRDDQAMQEVLDVWRAHIGKLRSAVAAANGAGNGAQMRIPELGEGMTVQMVKGVDGAPKPCVVCGLKRDERVKGIDVDVEDSFGEWWVEHWGHRACRNFWYEHEEQLRSR